MRVPARCQSSSLFQLNSAFIASAMRQPCAKPNWVNTVRAAVRPKFSTRYLRSRPIATASSSSARCPAKRITPPSGSSSSSSLWSRSSARIAISPSFELKDIPLHFD